MLYVLSLVREHTTYSKHVFCYPYENQTLTFVLAMAFKVDQVRLPTRNTPAGNGYPSFEPLETVYRNTRGEKKIENGKQKKKE